MTQILGKGAMSQERLLEQLRQYVQLHVTLSSQGQGSGISRGLAAC